jgi:hypothetical protein
VTQPQLNLLAGISVAVCWVAFAVTWLAAENWNESRAPAERTRSWFGTAVLPGAVVITVELAVYSTHTGALLRTAAPWVWRWPSPPGRGGWPIQTLAWSTRSGSQLIVLQPRDDLDILGVASAGTFSPAGGQLLPQQPAGYREPQYALRTSSQLAW